MLRNGNLGTIYSKIFFFLKVDKSRLLKKKMVANIRGEFQKWEYTLKHHFFTIQKLTRIIYKCTQNTAHRTRVHIYRYP